MKTSQEFVVGKHNIGWINDRFLSEYKDTEFEAKNPPTFQKLSRSMTDAEIESNLKPGLSELGDVLAFLDNAPEECKDGYANLFYTTSCVVGVYWRDGDWHVFAWSRRGDGWHVDGRVFSPATVDFVVLDPESLKLRIFELEEFRRKVEKILKI